MLHSKIFSTLALLFLSAYTLAETVKLKITYNGKGVDGHTVSVMYGDNVLGNGTTDDDGNVSINVSSLPIKSIDLKGEKTCSNARKSWEVKGYVTLDDNNYAHLKMEEPMSEMAEASGGFMSVSSLANAYGLVCAGSSSSSSDNGSSGSSDGTSGSSAGSTSSSTTDLNLPTREEQLASKKEMLESKIQNIDRKIERKQEKANSDKTDAKDKNDLLYDIKELEIEKKIEQNELEKTNLTIEKGRLNKSDRQRFKDNEDNLKEELKQVKEDKKSGESLVSEEELAADYEYTEEELKDMTTMKLKKEKVGLKSTLSKRKLKLKTKKKFLSPNEVTALEEEIAKLEAAIETLQAEIDARGGEEQEQEEEEEQKQEESEEQEEKQKL